MVTIGRLRGSGFDDEGDVLLAAGGARRAAGCGPCSMGSEGTEEVVTVWDTPFFPMSRSEDGHLMLAPIPLVGSISVEFLSVGSGD